MVTAHPRPAAVAVRSFHPDWPENLALSYSSVIQEQEVFGEAGRPVVWICLRTGWSGYFSEDPGTNTRARRLASPCGVAVMNSCPSASPRQGN